MPKNYLHNLYVLLLMKKLCKEHLMAVNDFLLSMNVCLYELWQFRTWYFIVSCIKNTYDEISFVFFSECLKLYSISTEICFNNISFDFFVISFTNRVILGCKLHFQNIDFIKILLLKQTFRLLSNFTASKMVLNHS